MGRQAVEAPGFSRCLFQPLARCQLRLQGLFTRRKCT
jgi:hypothetical protein